MRKRIGKRGDMTLLIAVVTSVLVLTALSALPLVSRHQVQRESAALSEDAGFYAGEIAAISVYFAAGTRGDFRQGAFALPFVGDLRAGNFRATGTNVAYRYWVNPANHHPTYCGEMNFGNNSEPTGVCVTRQCSDGTDNNRTATFGGEPFSFSSNIASQIATRGLPFTGISAGLPIVRSTGGSGGGNVWDDNGVIDQAALDMICNIYGYRRAISSTCPDSERSGRYPGGKCNFHSPGDNQLQTLNGYNFSIGPADPKYGNTWLASLTCQGQVTCPWSAMHPTGAPP